MKTWLGMVTIVALAVLGLASPHLYAQDPAPPETSAPADDAAPAPAADADAPPAEEASAPEAAPDPLNGADTAWMLVSSALVLMMTAPGLALFYCGLVRKKNVLGVMMQCVFLMGLLSVAWALWGYSLAFGSDMLGGIVGGSDYLFLQGVIPSWDATAGKAVVP